MRIIGLGNNLETYKSSRHNIGFMFLNYISKKEKIQYEKNEKYDFFIFNNNLFIKPNTLMNNSGNSINFYNNQETIVVYDDFEIDFGKISTKFGGSARGHNGVKSIIEKIGYDFYRFRIGIGPKNNPINNFVLSDFTFKEKEKLNEIFEFSYEILIYLIKNKEKITKKYNIFK